MRQLFFRLLPYLTGALLGFLVFFPPAAFEAMGVWRFPALAAILVVGLLAGVGLQMAVTLPADPKVEPVDEAPPPEVAELIGRFAALGFEPAERALEIHLRPTATLWVLHNATAGCWASVGLTSTLPRRSVWEISSVIDGPRQGALATLANPMAAVLPLPPGQFKQVIRGAAPAEALAQHQEAVAFLARHGVRFEAHRRGDIPGQVRRDLIEQRQAILANPVRAAVTALWRSLTRRTPFEGPLSAQQGMAATLRQRQATTPG